jgi:hypothetical protein
LIDAPTAAPSPVFVRVTVHENGLPAEIVCVDGVFVMPMVAQLMTVVALAWTLLSPVAEPVAVFVMPLVLQLVPAVVVALITAVMVALAARSTGPQFSVPLVMAQLAPEGLELPSV